LSMFGAKPASTSFSFGSANPTTTTAGTTSLFGAAPAASTAKPLFGSTVPQASTALFGNTSTSATPNKLFAPATSSSALFGNTSSASTGLFGASSTSGGLFSKPSTTPFGTTTTTGLGAKPLFGAPAGASNSGASFGTRASLQAIVQNSETVVGCVTKVELYGDERDRTITRLNQISASLGVGKAQYKKDQGVEFDKNGPFFRLKSIGYNSDSVHSDEDGLVMLILKVPANQISNSQQRQAVVDELYKIVESKPELKAHIERVQPMDDSTTKLVVYVTQSGMGRVKATQLAAFFQQPTKKAALENQLKVDKETISALVAMDSQKKRLFLNSVPQGYDQSTWDEAIRENPSPATLIPYPIRGFDQLVTRQKAHSTQVEAQNRLLDLMDNRCKSLEASLASARGRSEQCMERHKLLSYRLLRIMGMEEMTLRFAHSIDETEEEMQTVLEAMNAKLNAPNGIKSNYHFIIFQNRLMSLMDTISNDASLKTAPKTTPFNQENMVQLKKYLSKCQDGLESLSQMIQNNSEDVRVMEKYVSRN
ncbi:hypothetical protein PENTCL1PPCAC_17858, partial [Pristionchus entomophagus]